MRLIVDMNLSPGWVETLKEVGHDVLHWSSVGPAGASDQVILRWALEQDRTVLTSDLDFGTQLATSGATKPSVVQLRSSTTLPARIGPFIVQVLERVADDLRVGALVTVYDDRLRVRLLTYPNQQ